MIKSCFTVKLILSSEHILKDHGSYKYFRVFLEILPVPCYCKLDEIMAQVEKVKLFINRNISDSLKCIETLSKLKIFMKDVSLLGFTLKCYQIQRLKIWLDDKITGFLCFMDCACKSGSRKLSCSYLPVYHQLQFIFKISVFRMFLTSLGIW